MGAARARSRFPATFDLPVCFGAACWTLSGLYFLGQALAQAASARPYSLITNVISDLGNTACGPAVCSPWHGLMDATFIAVGLLHCAGAITTQQAFPPGRLRAVSAALLALAGVGLALAGAAPENTDASVHIASAFLGLASLNAGMITLGVTALPSTRWGGVLALAAGLVGGLGFLLFLMSLALSWPRGITERVADYPGATMIVVLGVLLLAHGRAAAARASRSVR